MGIKTNKQVSIAAGDMSNQFDGVPAGFTKTKIGRRPKYKGVPNNLLIKDQYLTEAGVPFLDRQQGPMADPVEMDIISPTLPGNGNIPNPPARPMIDADYNPIKDPVITDYQQGSPAINTNETVVSGFPSGTGQVRNEVQTMGPTGSVVTDEPKTNYLIWVILLAVILFFILKK